MLCDDILGLIGNEVSVIRAHQKHRKQMGEICRVIDGAQATSHHCKKGMYWSPGPIETGFIGKPFGQEIVEYIFAEEEMPEGSVYDWCFTNHDQ